MDETLKKKQLISVTVHILLLADHIGDKLAKSVRDSVYLVSLQACLGIGQPLGMPWKDFRAD